VEKEKDLQLKSWVLMLAGFSGIGYQQWTGEVDLVLLAVFTLMAGVPGAAQLISLIRNSPIVMQSSSSPPESLDTEQENSSTN
jgi:hypothetical protein